jgi:hypothetical protein
MFFLERVNYSDQDRVQYDAKRQPRKRQTTTTID